MRSNNECVASAPPQTIDNEFIDLLFTFADLILAQRQTV